LGLDLPGFAVFPAMAIRSPGPARTSPLLLNCQSAEDNQAGIEISRNSFLYPTNVVAGN